MSKIKLIRGFAFRCLNCNTRIQFAVPLPHEFAEKENNLSTTVSTLVCPRCGTSLSDGASKTLDAIKSYNASAFLLNISIDNNTVEIE